MLNVAIHIINQLQSLLLKVVSAINAIMQRSYEIIAPYVDNS